MKLLQLNTWAMRLDKQITELIQKEQPDIICFQEVLEASHELGFSPTLTEFQSSMSYHQYFSPFYSFRFMHQNAEFGNAILSKSAFNNKTTIFTSKQYVEGFSFDHDDYNVRNLQHATIMLGGKTVHILNHHGYHISKHKHGDEHTLRACEQIANYIAALDGPVILAGDFNLLPESKSLQLLNQDLRNLSLENNLTTTRNFLTTKTEVCDYIFVNDLVNVRDFHMSDSIASDHNALVLEFDVS